MLFNSVMFITIFLPLALIGWYVLQKLENPIFAKVFLIGMSLWFYGYYNPWYLFILIGSLVGNFLVSSLLEHTALLRYRKVILWAGLAGNIGLIFYFKYFNFFLDNANYLLHTSWHIEQIALPLGISFFTFQQISFIVDRYWREAPHYSFVDYACFITFFPQLIAGPIVMHNEFIPQLQKRENRRLDPEGFYDGLALFIMGLGKKVLLADVLAIVVNAEYQNIAALDAPAAWVTIICFGLELYFDFSGYCDMARGIARLFGFWLPENFNAPLKAESVTELWRRWHMTLTRFLTRYIYIPLGGNRRGKAIKCRNLLIVFLVSGIWHGANWTYIVWGLMHGVATVCENLFPKMRFPKRWMNQVTMGIFFTLSFSIFRCDSLAQAWLLWQKLFTGGFHRFTVGLSNVLQVPENYALRKLLGMAAPGALNPMYLGTLALLLVISVVLVAGPKAEDWLKRHGRSLGGMLLLTVLGIWSVVSLSQVSTFLYFDF